MPKVAVIFAGNKGFVIFSPCSGFGAVLLHARFSFVIWRRGRCQCCVFVDRRYSQVFGFVENSSALANSG